MDNPNENETVPDKSMDKIEIEMENSENANTDEIQNGTITKIDDADSKFVEVVIKDGEDQEIGYDLNKVDDDETKQIVQDVFIEDEFHGKEKQPESRLG
jgi:hypothetical protein